MLQEYCTKLSDAAQLEIAIRLIRLALPIWQNHVAKHGDDLKKINSLIGTENKVTGAAGHIDNDLPGRYLQKIERSYSEAKAANERPVPVMKKDLLLQPLLATIMQPLTNAGWDNALPYPVRLVYTSVWNVLTWLIYRRMNDSAETHIYIAINQAADALMTEKILSIDEINAVLSEYADRVRADGEDAAWENAPGADTKTGSVSMTDVYRKIAGDKITGDPPVDVQIKEIMRQMRDEDKSYWDEWEEYLTGTCTTYSYNKEKQSFWVSEADVIAASFFNEYALSEQQMYDYAAKFSLHDLRKSGFEI